MFANVKVLNRYIMLALFIEIIGFGFTKAL